jgi:hypothetical protein
MVYTAYTRLVSVEQLRQAYMRICHQPTDNGFPTQRLILSIRDAYYRHANIELFYRIHETSPDFVWMGAQVAMLANGSRYEGPKALNTAQGAEHYMTLSKCLPELGLGTLPTLQLFS